MNKELESWIEMNGAQIISDRDALTDESLYACAINNRTGQMIDLVNYKPSGEQKDQYAWPKLFSDAINRTTDSIRAGEKIDHTFKTRYSGFLNKLWHSSSDDLRVFTTACHLDNWMPAGSIASAASLLPDASITLTVKDSSTGHLVETLTFHPTKNQAARYDWPFFLSHFINTNSMFLRAGEKNLETRLIAPLLSGYRNTLWLPAHCALTATLEHAVAQEVESSANTIHTDLIYKLRTTPPARSDIDRWVATLKNGCFTDIEYPTGKKVKPVALYTHIERAQGIANYIARNQDSAPDSYIQGAIDALNFYAQQDYDTANWWDRNIGLGRKSSIAALLLSTVVRQNRLKTFIDYIKQVTNAEAPETGANLADYCFIQLIWSLAAWKTSAHCAELEKTYAAYQVLSSLCFPVQRHGKEMGEGISVDYSYSQHNRGDGQYSQLYGASYGLELLARIDQSMSVSNGIFAFSRQALASIEEFLAEGMGWMGCSRVYDFHPCGRALSRGSKSNGTLANWAERLIKHGAIHPEKLQELIKRASGNETNNQHYIGNRIFWVNDYMSHMTPHFCLFAKTISDRSIGSESGNGENLKGFYLGAGSSFVIRHGDEYRDIQPVWDWQRIPGTTVEQVPDFKFPLINWGHEAWGSHPFAGGASNGLCGINSMKLAKRQITNAHKSVIALQESAVFLGSAIDATTAAHHVTTAVNQCRLKGKVTVTRHDGSRFNPSLPYMAASTDIALIEHDGLFYRFRKEHAQQVTLQLAEQTGSWRSINISGSQDTVKERVFSIWINHAKGTPGTYAYEIGSIEVTSKECQWTNSETAHMVLFCAPVKAIGTLFDTSTRLDIPLGGGLAVTPLDAVSFIIEEHKGYLNFTCADPSQQLEAAQFVISTPIQGAPTNTRTGHTITIPLPSDDMAGKSAQYAHLIPVKSGA